MNEQAKGIGAALRAGVARLPAPFVLVSGGKGGVGKSTLAANLGVDLARAGTRVLLVDLDLGLANLALLLGVRTRGDIEDFVCGRLALEQCVAPGPAGVHVLPASSGSADMGRPDRARREVLLAGLAELAPRYDLIIGDGAAGIGPDALAFAACADCVLAVTTDEPAALTDAYGVVKALHGWSTERDLEVATPELVVNHAAGTREAERTAARLESVCRRFLARAPRLAGWLPESRAVAASARTQRPFVLAAPDSLAARQVARLARRLLRLCVTRPAPSAPQGPHGSVR